jgi:hypothetical protein
MVNLFDRKQKAAAAACRVRSNAYLDGKRG